MREQSATYYPFANVRNCDMRITLRAESPGARETASISTSNGGEDMTVEQLKGWISTEQSGEDGFFASPPYIYAAFPEPISTVGITLYFGGAVFPKQVRITAFAADGVTYQARGTFLNSKAIAALELTANDYSYIKIEFLAMETAGVAVQLEDIIFGLQKIYDKNSIEAATIINKAGFAGESLPSQQLTFTIDNSNREYDILNPTGIYKYLEKGQAIDVECIVDGESVFMGTYYFQTASTPSSSILTTIKATDKILNLDKRDYINGANRTDTLENVVADVLEDTGITARYEGALANTIVSKAIDVRTSKREALRLLAQAACCSCWINRDGELYFGSLELRFPSHRIFTHDNLDNLSGFSIVEQPDVLKLEVNNSFTGSKGEYFRVFDDAWMNVKTIRNPCVVDGKAVVNWLGDCYLRRRRYKMPNRGDPALEIGDTIMIYDPYKTDFYATITGITLKYDGGFSVITEGVGPGKPIMVFPYYSNELFSGELLNA